jgi:hypothetical protein
MTREHLHGPALLDFARRVELARLLHRLQRLDIIKARHRARGVN